MAISFLHPFYLLVLLGVPLLWFVPRRLVDWRQGVLRTLVLVLLIGGLARPVLLWPDQKTYQVFIIDRSASVSVERQQRAQEILDALLQQVPAEDKVSMISVGDGVSLQSADDGLHVSGVSRSSLSAALKAASQEIPTGSRGAVTLISDGLATDRRWGSAVQDLIERSIPVNTYDLGVDVDDVYPSRVHSGSPLRVGQTAIVTVDVIGTARGIKLRLLGSDGEIAVSELFDSNARASIPLEFEPKEAGFLELTAEVVVTDGTDSDSDNNRMTQSVAVQGPLRVLYLGGRMSEGAAKLASLIGRGFEVSEAGDEVLDESFRLDRYDLVMVDDRPAREVPEAFQEHLVSAVQQQGLGVLFSGGKSSFGSGGYDKTALAKILPVELDQRDEKRDPSVSLAIIIDTSGSMGGDTLDNAKHIARLAVRGLRPHDWVGVLEYHGSKHWAVPMQSAQNKLAVDRVIARMQAGGGNVLMPVLEEAYYGLKNMQTRYKHILLITDAGNEDADYERVIRVIAAQKINLSTVKVGMGGGSGPDSEKVLTDLMFNMAAWGRGRFYPVTSEYDLVELILKQPSTSKLPSYQTGEFPVRSRGGPGWWGKIDRTRLPPLSGYVDVKERPGAEVLIDEEGRGDPVLTTWRHGLGRVTALMTEPFGPGTDSWSEWTDYGALLGRIISRTALDIDPFEYEISRNGHKVKVTAQKHSRDVELRPAGRVLGELRENEDGGTPLDFQERAPGLYEAELIVSPGESLRFVAGVSGSGGQGDRKIRLVSAVREDIFPERQVDPASGLDLFRLAQVTSGEVIQDDAPRLVGQDIRGVSDSLNLFRLWPYLLLLALIAYLGELLYRRWPRVWSAVNSEVPEQ